MLDSLATYIENGILLALMVPLAMTIWRLIAGPTYVDRIVALDMLTGIAVALAAVTAATTGRREFLDVGFGLALISFIGICALSAFLERKERSDS